MLTNVIILLEFNNSSKVRNTISFIALRMKASAFCVYPKEKNREVYVRVLIKHVGLNHKLL